MSYHEFLEAKTQLGGNHGFNPVFMPKGLFDFQGSLVDWSVNKGRAAIFADCGLGKTFIQLVWAQNVVMKTNKSVLLLTPLAVSYQSKTEAAKFGIDAEVSRDGTVHKGITITNYERLHYFNPDDFIGVVCDESSILKNYSGATKQAITAFMRKIPYRLLCTATAAPNDYHELGTSSEALGYMGYMDMLNRFFKNDLNNSATGRMRGAAIKWRFKGHAELPFWRWVCSWARAIRKPSDLGFNDDLFTLPKLTESEHLVEAKTLADGMLFALPAVGMKEEREERKRTIHERCEKMAELANHNDPALAWCHLNEEGDILEKLIPDCVQVSGKDSDDTKESKMIEFASGNARVLVTKHKIGAWGLNFQHCNHVLQFPSHSYEQQYQGIRRCWRFGQKRPVHVDTVTTDGERGIVKNMQRKASQADKMFENLVAEMNQSMSIERINNLKNREAIPSWL